MVDWIKLEKDDLNGLSYRKAKPEEKAILFDLIGLAMIEDIELPYNSIDNLIEYEELATLLAVKETTLANTIRRFGNFIKIERTGDVIKIKITFIEIAKDKIVEKSDKAKNASKARWGKEKEEETNKQNEGASNASAMQTHNASNANAMQTQCRVDQNRVEENRVEENRVEENRVEENILNTVLSSKLDPAFLKAEDCNTQAIQLLKSSKPTKPQDPPPKTDGSQVFEAYSASYQERYKIPPVRNAKTNALCSQLVKRLGLQEALQTVKFYITHNDAFYFRSGHSLSLLVRDAEKLRTECLTGAKTTMASSQKVDKQQTKTAFWNEMLEKARTQDEINKQGAI
jgi:hypothetical protein